MHFYFPKSCNFFKEFTRKLSINFLRIITVSQKFLHYIFMLSLFFSFLLSVFVKPLLLTIRQNSCVSLNWRLRYIVGIIDFNGRQSKFVKKRESFLHPSFCLHKISVKLIIISQFHFRKIIIL